MEAQLLPEVNTLHAQRIRARRGRRAKVTRRIRNYFFLIHPMMNSNTIAPTTAVMRDPISPLEDRPTRLKRNPLIRAQIPPITKSQMRPNPLPFVILPANQPAINPMIEKQTNSNIIDTLIKKGVVKLKC